MKKIGRGRDYKSALSQNLLKNLKLNSSIKTTKTKGKAVARDIVKKYKGKATIVPLGKRKGDGAAMVKVIWENPNRKEISVSQKIKENSKEENIKNIKTSAKVKPSSKTKDSIKNNI